MEWKPVASPYTRLKRLAYNAAVQIRAAVILLVSAWHLRPSHFRADSKSIYKNLGWWLPLVPGTVYAWGVQQTFAPAILQGQPDSLVYLFGVGNMAVVPFMAYTSAAISYGAHSSVCFAGKIFSLDEKPPPFEFFLVRASGACMWFAVSVCLMAVPVLALQDGTTGWIASFVFSFPIIWALLFFFAGHSWQRADSTSRVDLDEMYESDEFKKLLWRTKFFLALLSVALLLIAAWHLNTFPFHH